MIKPYPLKFLTVIRINGVLYDAYIKTAHDERGHYVDDFELRRTGMPIPEFQELDDNDTFWIFGYLNQELAKVGP